MTIEVPPPEKAKDDAKPKRYESQDGFVEAKIYRGWRQVKGLVDILLRLELDNKACVCGGFVRWMCSPRLNPVVSKDIDIYCYDQAAFDVVRDELEQLGLEVRDENDMAITFVAIDDHEHALFPLPAIQLIKPMKDGAVVTDEGMQVILENFDFTIVRCGFDAAMHARGLALVDADFEHDEGDRIIRIKNIHCPVSSIYRVIKYSKKGYWLQSPQLLKIFNDWMERSPEYIERINELVGQDGLTEEEVNELERMMRIVD